MQLTLSLRHILMISVSKQKVIVGQMKINVMNVAYQNYQNFKEL